MAGLKHPIYFWPLALSDLVACTAEELCPKELLLLASWALIITRRPRLQFASRERRLSFVSASELIFCARLAHSGPSHIQRRTRQSNRKHQSGVFATRRFYRKATSLTGQLSCRLFSVSVPPIDLTWQWSEPENATH